MDKTKLLEMLNNAADFVEALTPIAVAIGGPIVGKVLDVIAAVDDVVENIAALAKEGTAVLASDDILFVEAALARIKTANDALSEYIANS
jgi:hypothetical protein